MIVAACEYPAGSPQSFAAWQEKVSALTAQAVAAGAELLVYPEYASMELPAFFSRDVQQNLAAQIAAMQDLREEFVGTFRCLAAEHRISILAPSFPWRLDCGRYVNRAWLCTPQGEPQFQDKLIMTRFENEEWSISPGTELKVLEIPGARVGVCICYDSEFPLLARRLVEAGAELILVPSCTDTAAGYHRVMLSCRARALENQCFVIQSPITGAAEWSPAIDVNTGQAGIFAPVDRGFPDDGVIAMGTPPETAPWLIADLPIARIGSVRRHGQVRNFADWPLQEKFVIAPL